MATNYVKASYTEVVDLQTTNGKTSIIGIHTPVGIRPYHRLFGFFNQFQKYRYKGISSLVMVPAANLPVDPLGLTGIQGTTDLMDPRDALNPIIFHGAHGERLSEVLDMIYSSDEQVGIYGDNGSYTGRNVSDSTSETLNSNAAAETNYYKCLTDPTWRKFGIQSGVKLKGLHPLVWKLARNMPLVPGYSIGQSTNGDLNAASGNAGRDVETVYNDRTLRGYQEPTYPLAEVGNVGNISPNGTLTRTVQYQQDMTYGVARLGWMPTSRGIPSISEEDNVLRYGPAILPKIFMGVLVLPPSYNVEQYFRMVIKHEFEFKDFTTSLGLISAGAPDAITTATYNTTNYYNWIDYGSVAGSKDEKVDNVGDTLDMIGGESEVISDGVS